MNIKEEMQHNIPEIFEDIDYDKEYKIPEDKSILKFESLGDSKNTNFKDRHWFVLGIITVFTAIIVGWTFFMNNYHFVNFDIKDSSMNIVGYQVISNNYTIESKEIKPGEYVYYSMNKGHLPVFISDLDLGQVKRTSDMYAEVITSKNETITIPKYYIKYFKK